MAREVYLSSDPEQLLQIIDDLESDYSDDDFDGYIDDDDEEIQKRMTRVGEIGSRLGTDWGAGEGMEGLVSVSRGNAIGGSSDDDGNASIGMEVEFRDHGSESGSDSGSVGDGGDGIDSGDGIDGGAAARSMVMAPMTAVVAAMTMVMIVMTMVMLAVVV